MSGVLTSEQLIRSIKRRAMLPSDENTFTDEDYLEMLNEELQYFGVPHLLRTHEEYLLVFQDFALDGSQRYEIPYRALGNKLRDLSYVSGVDSNSEQISELSRISVDELSDYGNYNTSTYAQSFYLESNNIVILGEVPTANTALRMHY